MEVFNLIDNKLIDAIDKMAVSPPEPKPEKNSLKTIVKCWKTYTTGQNSSIYNQKFSIEIPKEYDNLSQIYVKCTLSNGSTACATDSYFGTKIFKYIRLKTKNGTILQTLTPRYLQARIDQVQYTPLYTWMQVSMEPDILFAAGDPTLFVPLFFFFSDEGSAPLPTRSLEQLEVEFITNDGYQALGMENDTLASIQTEMFCMFYDQNTNSKVPKYIKHSYNMYKEQNLTVLQNATSARLNLICPHPVFAINIALVNAVSARAQVKTLKISFADRTFLELDYRMNYSNRLTTPAFFQYGSLSYFFNKKNIRTVDSGLIQFVDSVAPVYIDLTFDALGSDHTMYTFVEYRTNFSVSESGIIGLSNDVSGWKEGLLALNSDTISVNLTE